VDVYVGEAALDAELGALGGGGYLADDAVLAYA